MGYRGARLSQQNNTITFFQVCRFHRQLDCRLQRASFRFSILNLLRALLSPPPAQASQRWQPEKSSVTKDVATNIFSNRESPPPITFADRRKRMRNLTGGNWQLPPIKSKLVACYHRNVCNGSIIDRQLSGLSSETAHASNWVAKRPAAYGFPHQ